MLPRRRTEDAGVRELGSTCRLRNPEPLAFDLNETELGENGEHSRRRTGRDPTECLGHGTSVAQRPVGGDETGPER